MLWVLCTFICVEGFDLKEVSGAWVAHAAKATSAAVPVPTILSRWGTWSNARWSGAAEPVRLDQPQTRLPSSFLEQGRKKGREKKHMSMAALKERDIAALAAKCPSTGYGISAALTASVLAPFLISILAGFRSEAIVGARRYCYVSYMIQALIFTMVIPNSLKLSRSMGHDEAMSGWIISSSMAGAVIGNFAVWLQNQLVMNGSLTYMRMVNFLATVLVVLGTCGFAGAAWLPSNIWVLLGARFVAGIGIGINFFAVLYFLNRTAEDREITDLNMIFAILGVVGYSVGPALTSGENEAFEVVCGSAVAGRTAEYQGMVVCALFLALPTIWFPAHEEFQDRIQKRNERQPSMMTDSSRLAVVACVGIMCLRNVSLSAIEAGTAMIFEEVLGLNSNLIGLLMGVSCIMTVPLKLLFDHMVKVYSQVNVVRVGLLLCAIGCILIREDVGELLGGKSRAAKVAIIIAADIFMYAPMFLLSGVVNGVAFRLAGPDGTVFSVNNITLAFMFLPGGARFIGPPIVRAVLSHSSGQTSYSWLQLVVISLVCVMQEWTVSPKLREFERVEGQKGRDESTYAKFHSWYPSIGTPRAVRECASSCVFFPTIASPSIPSPRGIRIRPH